jgi:hypothetical protein
MELNDWFFNKSVIQHSKTQRNSVAKNNTMQLREKPHETQWYKKHN